MNLLRCTVYLVVVATTGFLIGRILPKSWINPEKGLFRTFSFEKNGAIYEKLGIRKWHKKLPDMSHILPCMMPAKELSGNYCERLPEMIRETCVAEVINVAVSIAGLHCLRLWPGLGGVVVTGINIFVLNFPFVLIQRYNRPRLMRLERKVAIQKNPIKELPQQLCIS